MHSIPAAVINIRESQVTRPKLREYTHSTTQSIIIGELSSYARINRTKKALWEQDNIYRSSYLLTYVDSVMVRRNVQRALKWGESYHELRRAVAYAYSGRLRVKTDLGQNTWSECSRLLAIASSTTMPVSCQSY